MISNVHRRPFVSSESQSEQMGMIVEEIALNAFQTASQIVKGTSKGQTRMCCWRFKSGGKGGETEVNLSDQPDKRLWKQAVNVEK